MSQQPNERMFREKLSILNENFLRFFQTSLRDFPDADYTPTALNYVSHVQELDEMYAIGDGPAIEKRTPMTSGNQPASSKSFNWGDSTTSKLPFGSAVTTSATPTVDSAITANTNKPSIFASIFAPPKDQPEAVSKTNGPEIFTTNKSFVPITVDKSGDKTEFSQPSSRKRKPDAPLDYDKMKATTSVNGNLFSTTDTLKFNWVNAPASSTLTFGVPTTTKSATPAVDSITTSNTNKPSIFASIFAPQAPTNATVKTNGGDKVDGAEKGSDDEGEPQEEPPKPEEVEQTEKDATFSAKCVVHTFSNGKFEKKGVAYISLKNVDDGRKQIIIRAATTIGAIWTNTFTDHLKWNKADKTRLQITYPLADSKSGPTSETLLLRVSKPEELDALIKEFEAQKSS